MDELEDKRVGVGHYWARFNVEEEYGGDEDDVL